LSTHLNLSFRDLTDDHEYNRSDTTAAKPGHLDQPKARCSEQRAVQVSQWRADQRSYVKEEADDERRDEKENCGGTAGEMGEAAPS